MKPTVKTAAETKESQAVIQAPLIFTATGESVDFANFYRGRSAFLICGGPSFGKLDPTKLRRPGILTMGVNNSVKTFRPQLWTCVDNPDHFLRSIWLDPTIIKFAPIKQIKARVFDSDRWECLPLRISQCPATFFYHRNAEFNAERFLTEPTINWGNGEGNGGGRSVMLVALRLLYHLGVRRIFLLGCDFKMDAGYTYHFEQRRQPGSVNGNNNSYQLLKERFKLLRPVFEAAGLRVLNSNPESGLDAFDKITFEEALDMADEEWGRINLATERSAGLYDESKPTPPSAPVPRNRFWHEEPVMPALAHFVWLGSPLPKLAAEFLGRFKTFHPGWEVKLWTEIPAEMPAVLQCAARSASLLCQQADLVRLWALQTFGGISLDADIYVLRNLEELRHYENFIVQGTGRKLSTGVMGFAPQSPALSVIWKRAGEIAADSTRNTGRTFLGADLFTQTHASAPDKLNVLPTHYFYIIRTQGTALDFVKWPLPEQERKLNDLRGRMDDDTHPFGIHLWGFPAGIMPAGVGNSAEARNPNPSIAASKPTSARAEPKVGTAATQPQPTKVQAPSAKMDGTRKVVLTAPSFLGDQVVFTGVVRELQRAAPGRFLVDVQTSIPDLWLNNPYRTRFDRADAEVQVFADHYCPAFRRANQTPMHFLELYARRVGDALGVKLSVAEFRGDMHLGADEAAAPPYPQLAGTRYWVVVAGCKKGVPIKGWGSSNYQAVVDAFQGRMQFAQVGSRSDAHPPLRNAINLVGKTSVRELIRLIYHAEGVLCPITAAMHLAAAVPNKPGGPRLRPCVVIAGGREAVHYIAYPGHRVLHTIGALPCCASGGCGKSYFGATTGGRVCDFPVAHPDGSRIPKCMSLVRVQDVVDAIELYYHGGLPNRASLPARQ